VDPRANADIGNVIKIKAFVIDINKAIDNVVPELIADNFFDRWIHYG
jgi:hypothetical protein